MHEATEVQMKMRKHNLKVKKEGKEADNYSFIHSDRKKQIKKKSGNPTK